MAKTVRIVTLKYYNHPEYYPYMTEAFYNLLEDAFLNQEKTVAVPSREFNKMIKDYSRNLPKEQTKFKIQPNMTIINEVFWSDN